MSSELVATYSALGTKDGDEYYKGQECLACVKDLIRALRRDDDHCGVRRHLGKAHVLQTDLIPLLVHFSDDVLLRNDLIRLLVNLTQPACLCFPEARSHKDTTTTKCLMEVSQYLRQYKEEFTVERVMNVLGTILAELCQKDWEDRDDDDVIIIERILLLIRNILHVPSEPSEEKRTDDDVSVHDQVIWNIHINGIDELLLFLGSNPNEAQWCMHVLEILFLLLREQSPSNLANAGEARSMSERQKDEDKIDELMAIERLQREKSKKLQGSRHSKFGGVYTVTNHTTSSGRNRVYHRSLAGVNDYSYDIEKRPRRTPKPKQRVIIGSRPRLSTYSIRLVLKGFCVQVLEYCFNVLMRVVKDTIKRLQSMDNDETYYLWAMRFFMEFSRLHHFRVDIVSESLQLPTVHQVLQLTANYYEHMFMNKRDRPAAIEWGQRLHYAVRSYKELLLHIREMSQSKDSTIVQSSKVILSNLLYHPEYRDVFVMLLRNYNEAVLSITFLEDVIEMTHVYLQLVKLYSKQNGQLVIQKKRKSHAVTRKKKVPQSMTEEQLLEYWDSIENEVDQLVTDEVDMSDCPCPFDAASDEPMEEQKINTMKQIHKDICDHQISNALLMMKAAREIWPEDVFGSSSLTATAEKNVLRDLFFNPMSITAVTREENEEEEDGVIEETITGVELELDLNRFTSTFANNKIVLVYSLVLANYMTNSDELNHAVVKMLHTIAVKHEMMPMLFQISLFKTFSSILDTPSLPRYKELQKFSQRVVADFFALSQHNNMIFAELLVWKTSGDCYDLKEGYGALQRRKELKQNRTIWSREQEEELSHLYEQFKDESDIVGCILAALPSEQCRTRNIIASQLVAQGLVSNRRDLHKKSKTSKGPWSEEELFTLQSLWAPNDDINEAIKQLTDYFPERGVRDIRQQLQQLGLIKSSKKQVANKAEEQDITVTSVPKKVRAKKKGKKGNIESIVQSIHSSGFSDQLSWLTTYISDEAKDRTLDNEWEELCIVTVDQSVAEALVSDLFCDLMASLGLIPPTEQEMYWRIPSTFSPQDLERITALLSVAPTGITDTQVLSSSSDEDEDPQLTIVTDPEESMTPSEALALLKRERASTNSRVDLQTEQPVAKKTRLSTQFDSDEEEQPLDSSATERPLDMSTVSEKELLDTSGQSLDTSCQSEPRRLKRNALFDSDEDDDSDNTQQLETIIEGEMKSLENVSSSPSTPVSSQHESQGKRQSKRRAMFDSDSEDDI